MEQQLQLFEHEQFGKIRVVMIEGDPWFVAVDVCRALELKNPRDALSRLYDKEKQTIVLPDKASTNGVTNSVASTDAINDATSGWIKNRVNVVNEPGLYRLVFSSRKKEAVDFQDWVYYEVLPSIRKTGSYSIVKPAAKREPNPKRRAGQLKAACVYVFLLSSGIIKIGQSSDVRRRRAEIRRETGLSIEKVYRTNLMSREVARLIERLCHEIFSSSKTDGEFFCVEFDMACKVINAFAEFGDTLANIEHGKILVLTSKDNVKLIADRN